MDLPLKEDRMLEEKPELSRLRLECLRTSDAAEFRYCYAAYRRKGGLRKIIFYPKRKIKMTYLVVVRFQKGRLQKTQYRNQICEEFAEDCAMLRKGGMAYEDIATALEKNYGFSKTSTIKYACCIANNRL